MGNHLTFKEDGKIKFSFYLQNVSGKEQQISYGSGQKYDIFICNEQNEEVYKYLMRNGT
ncbi:BsuPI-related putative proteinase inhibitor [Paenibacillus qinlingensis]|uniref:Intracellular proteinase inhibitor BsuPI domain-containing protein n=1 Tax=Paenibacillus qinlingensis TaxID=1837343 RepID=A0ABU1NWR1_9BACL|nr:BsuPI-related putative proteinase inhibitor [Paenibacillus qinlingensis]MDR6551870.1 hypothetical protein [Paenibacillus qinlingensis]